MELVYCTNIDKGIAFLDKDEAMHVLKVRRKHKGDGIVLTDGCGNLYEGIITQDNPNQCEVRITSKKQTPPSRNYYLHMYTAPLKSRDRYEWFIEKAVEIGVDEITPVITKYTERIKLRADRLEKIAVAAMKQSQGAFLPIINEITNFDDCVDQLKGQVNFIAHCYDTPRTMLVNELQAINSQDKKQPIGIFIGPEGDFSPEEVAKAMECNIIPVKLSGQRLRTETAAIVAVATVASQFELV